MPIIAEKQLRKIDGGYYTAQLERANRTYTFLLKEGEALVCPPIEVHHDPRVARQRAAELLREMRS